VLRTAEVLLSSSTDLTSRACSATMTRAAEMHPKRKLAMSTTEDGQSSPTAARTPRLSSANMAALNLSVRPMLSDNFCRKLNQRLDLMCHATSVAGGVYMYANQRGCDGGRLYYDGSACVICNGQLLAQVSCLANDPAWLLTCMCSRTLHELTAQMWRWELHSFSTTSC